MAGVNKKAGGGIEAQRKAAVSLFDTLMEHSKGSFSELLDSNSYHPTTI